MIVHDFPHHPLGLPLLWTVLVEIDGSAESVRTALDRLLAHVYKTIEDRSGPAGLTRLERDDDGVWYVRFGLYGPALAVTDRWVVISYSPQAVRENVEYLEAVSKPTEDAQRRLKPAAPPVPAPPEQRAGRDAQTRTVPQR